MDVMAGEVRYEVENFVSSVQQSDVASSFFFRSLFLSSFFLLARDYTSP